MFCSVSSNNCCRAPARQHTILDIRCLLEPSSSTELYMCDEISILANFWMFVRSVTQYFVRIVAQYQYQAIVIYTRFSTKIDACLWKFKTSTSYFCLLVEVLSSFILDSRRKLISVCLVFHKPVCKYIL